MNLCPRRDAVFWPVPKQHAPRHASEYSNVSIDYKFCLVNLGFSHSSFWFSLQVSLPGRSANITTCRFTTKNLKVQVVRKERERAECFQFLWGINECPMPLSRLLVNTLRKVCHGKQRPCCDDTPSMVLKGLWSSFTLRTRKAWSLQSPTDAHTFHFRRASGSYTLLHADWLTTVVCKLLLFRCDLLFWN